MIEVMRLAGKTRIVVINMLKKVKEKLNLRGEV